MNESLSVLRKYYGDKLIHKKGIIAALALGLLLTLPSFSLATHAYAPQTVTWNFRDSYNNPNVIVQNVTYGFETVIGYNVTTYFNGQSWALWYSPIYNITQSETIFVNSSSFFFEADMNYTCSGRVIAFISGGFSVSAPCADNIFWVSTGA